MEIMMNKITKNLEADLNDYVFSIYDKVAQIFEPPFTEKNKGTAIRRIQDLVQSNGNSPYAKFPDNFSLFHIGFYDSSCGGILDLEPEHVITLDELTKPKEEN
jgi:hypothetical protein